MLESIWEAIVHILSRGPWFDISDAGESGWKNALNFSIFLGILSSIYFFLKKDVATAFLILGISFLFYLFLPDENGMYPTWKIITLSLIFLGFGVLVLSII